MALLNLKKRRRKSLHKNYDNLNTTELSSQVQIPIQIQLLN